MIEERPKKLRMDSTLGILAKKRGLTLEDVARECGIGLTALYYYSTGQRMPTFKNALCLCRVLNITPFQLAEILGIDTGGIPTKPKKD